MRHLIAQTLLYAVLAVWLVLMVVLAIVCVPIRLIVGTPDEAMRRRLLWLRPWPLAIAEPEPLPPEWVNQGRPHHGRCRRSAWREDCSR